MQPTVQSLIDVARVQHWSFRDVVFPEGAALIFLNQRQRTLLAEHGPSIEGIVGVSAEIALAIDGLLVGVEADGTPYLADSTEDGISVHIETGGGQEPYIDTNDASIAVDPFGLNGGTPGFPLPPDFIRFIQVMLVLDDDTLCPVDINVEQQRLERGRLPIAFLNANRLIPARPKSQNNGSDIWDRVVSVQFSYIAMQTFTAVTNIVTLPTVLCEAFIASITNVFARQSDKLSSVERRAFLENEREMEMRLANVADHLVRTDNRVIVRR